MQLFYDPDFSDHHSFLSFEESHHCVKVLRKKPGDEIFITDGRGATYTAEISTANPKKCELRILGKRVEPSPAGYFHLAIAPTKNMDRMEWLVEKSTEIGLQEISFFYTRNSERGKFKTDRIVKKAIAAMKQSLSSYLPKINEPVKFEQILSVPAEQKIIAHYNDANRELKNVLKSRQSCLVLIGPEGDFSADEVESAKNNGFQLVNLGKNRLRTETAGLVACHTYALAHQ